MLRDGPIPRFLHGILEYVLGVLFIAAPFVFVFDSGAATGMSVAIGVLILILAAVSEGPVSLVNQLPVLVHVVMIYLLAVFLIAAPFLLDFTDEQPPRNFFIISGVLLLLITIGTRFKRSQTQPADVPDRHSRQAGRTEPADPSPSRPGQDAADPATRSGPPGSGTLPPVPAPHRPSSQPPPGSA